MDERLSHALCNRQPSNRITGCYRKPEADKDDLAIYVVECLERIGTMLSKNIQNAIERNTERIWMSPLNKGPLFTRKGIREGLTISAEDSLFGKHSEEETIRDLDQVGPYTVDFALSMG